MLLKKRCTVPLLQFAIYRDALFRDVTALMPGITCWFSVLEANPIPALEARMSRKVPETDRVQPPELSIGRYAGATYSL